jgi:hypothetical protein
MSSNLARVAALAAAAIALSASPAHAEPDGTLSSAEPKYEFAGGPGNGAVYTSDVSSRVPCNPVIFQCDTFLVQTEEDAADVVFSIAGEGDNTKDIDLHVYTSDAEGTQGDLIGESVSNTANETVSIGESEAGYYLVVVDYYLAVLGTYTGTAEFTPLPED